MSGERGEPERLSRDFDHRWHVAINKAMTPFDAKRSDAGRFMYDAKYAASEVPRLARLFRMEREGGLAVAMQYCSHSEPAPVAENYLTCCLGTKCRDCPFLLALDDGELSDEERDTAKAWTCVTHIISEGGDVANEGYVLTVDDRMYYDRLHTSLAEAPHADR